MHPLNDGFMTVRKAENGFVVEPPPRGDSRDLPGTYVFNDPAELGDFVRRWGGPGRPKGAAGELKVGDQVFYALAGKDLGPRDKPGDAVGATVTRVVNDRTLNLEYLDCHGLKVERLFVPHSLEEPGSWFRLVKA